LSFASSALSKFPSPREQFQVHSSNIETDIYIHVLTFQHGADFITYHQDQTNSNEAILSTVKYLAQEKYVKNWIVEGLQGKYGKGHTPENWVNWPDGFDLKGLKYEKTDFRYILTRNLEIKIYGFERQGLTHGAYTKMLSELEPQVNTLRELSKNKELVEKKKETRKFRFRKRFILFRKRIWFLDSNGYW